MVAAARRAAQGRAQRAAHHDRRPGLRRQRHVRRRHPDAGAGPRRQGRAALHAVPFDGALLADAGGADHRPQPPRGGLRRDLGAVDRATRATTRSSVRRTRPSAGSSPTTAMPRRGSARTTTRRASSTAFRARSTNGRRGWASSTSTASWAARPTSGSRTCSRITRRSFRGSASPATTSPPTWRTRRSRTCASLNAAAPDQPFFVYYVPGGSHSPHQPTKEWIDKFKGKFDMGWERMREQIFANQKRLGVIPANAKLTPWPDDLPKWESLSILQKKLYARQAEVFAGYTAYTDYEIGRVIQAVEDMGKLDNTLIIYIDGDNGTSPEGTLSGTYNQIHRLQRHPGRSRAAAAAASTRTGARRRRTRTWRSPGRGRSTRRSSGPSRSPRTSAGRGRDWPFRGPATSRTWAASATSSTTSSTSCPRSSKPPASRRRSRSTASSRSRSKA